MIRLTHEESKKIEEYYRCYHVKLFRIAAASFYNNNAIAEDVVAQLFLTVCQKPQKLLSHPNPEAWLVCALHMEISHEKRRRAKYQAVLVGIMPLLREDTAENRMQLDALYPGLRNMPEFQLVKWFVIDGYSIAEIANRLDISISACKKRLERARKTLSEKLREK